VILLAEVYSVVSQVQAKGGDKVSKGSVVNSNLLDSIKLKTFVALTMDVASASPRRYFFEARANILNLCLKSHGPFSICFKSNIYIYASDMMSN
jgi:hypothetical protein